MRTMLEHVIRRLKHDPNYAFKSGHRTRDLMAVVWHRGWQLLRGLWLHPWLGQSGRPLFCGRGVVVEHAYLVRCGASTILEDEVFISALSATGVRLGRNVTIGKRAILQCTGVIANLGEGMEIGDNSAVGAQSYLGGQGGIRIGRNVIMGPGVRIFSENHRFDTLEQPIRMQGEIRAAVTIEDDCWVGAGATILAGVTVAGGSVIAAGAVVTRNVPARCVVGGVPARPIGKRG